MNFNKNELTHKSHIKHLVQESKIKASVGLFVIVKFNRNSYIQ